MVKGMLNKRFFFILFVLALSVYSASAEMSFEHFYDQYLNFARINGTNDRASINFDSVSTKRSIEAPFYTTLDFVELLGLETFVSYNISRNHGWNDGAAFQSKGLNFKISEGIRINYENKIDFCFKPELYYYQNLEYDIIAPVQSEWGDYWTPFDNIQQFGKKIYFDFAWGQSYLRFNTTNLSLGFSTENIIIGPGRESNIILGDNAAGFPHIDLGTCGKVPVGNWGEGELKFVWGFLHESDYFDDDSSNDFGWITSTHVAFSPTFAPFFSMGANFLYYKPLSDWDGWDLIRSIPFVDKLNPGTDNKDVMLSLVFRFLLPESGFELYAEWARHDNIGTVSSWIESPEHTHGYTIGFSKILYSGGVMGKAIVLSFEMSDLAQERTQEIGPGGPWYRHSWTGWTQGYTNEGQLLGSAMGPGSNMQWLHIGIFTQRGLTGIFLRRYIHDNDYFYFLRKDESKEAVIDYFSELNLGVEQVFYMGELQLYGQATCIYAFNNNYQADENLFNMHFEVGVKVNY